MSRLSVCSSDLFVVHGLFTFDPHEYDTLSIPGTIKSIIYTITYKIDLFIVELLVEPSQNVTLNYNIKWCKHGLNYGCVVNVKAYHIDVSQYIYLINQNTSK